MKRLADEDPPAADESPQLTCWTQKRNLSQLSARPSRVRLHRVWTRTPDSAAQTQLGHCYPIISANGNSTTLAGWLKLAAEDLQRSRLQMLFFPSTGGRPASAPSPPSKTETWTSPAAGLSVPASWGRCLNSLVVVSVSPSPAVVAFPAGKKGKGTQAAVIWSVCQSAPDSAPIGRRWKYTYTLGQYKTWDLQGSWTNALVKKFSFCLLFKPMPMFLDGSRTHVRRMCVVGGQTEPPIHLWQLPLIIIIWWPKEKKKSWESLEH